MTFSWMHSPPLSPHSPEKFLAMHRREIKERAALLLRLGWKQPAIVARCRQLLKWEFECAPVTPLLDEVQKLVQQAASRESRIPK